MEEKNEYLNEERYNRTKKKISTVALLILIVGLSLGITLITIGIVKQNKTNQEYSLESKESVEKEIEEEKANLENLKSELETKTNNLLNEEKEKLEQRKNELLSKGIEYSSFAKYDEGEKYDLKIITNALDPSFDNCLFDEYKNNDLTSSYCLIHNKKDEDSKNLEAVDKALNTSFDYCLFDDCKNNVYTSKYCSLKDQLKEKNNRSRVSSYDSVPFYMIGTFVIITFCMISGSIYMITKRREIMAFTVQQSMPIAKEGIENIAPTMGKAGAKVMKEMAPAYKEVAKEVAPVYGEVAKEITKGVKEGLKETKKKGKQK